MGFGSFLGENIAHAYHVGHEVFFTVEGFCSVCTVIIGIHWKRKRKKTMKPTDTIADNDHELPKNHWWHHVENYLMLGGVSSGFIVFFIYAILIAPFERYEESERLRKDATNELAHLKPASGEASYQAQAKELAEAREGKIKAEIVAEQYRQQWLDSLLATNDTFTAIPVLDEAIAAAKRESTNTNPPQLGMELQRQSEVKKLQERRAVEEEKKDLANYSAMVRYVALAYKNNFSGPVARCGGILEPFPSMPNLDWWDGSSKRTNMISTNCGVKFEYSFWARADPTTVISAQSRRIKSRVEFIMSRHGQPLFHSRMYLGDEEIARATALENKTNCVKDVEYVLDLFLQSQKEEFQ